MKKLPALFSFFLVLILSSVQAQTFTPIATINYNLDAVAENTTAMATTAGPIDGSNNVMYSAAYGVLLGSTAGLPNNGLISSGTRTYQLQPYTQNNTSYLLGGQTDSIYIVTPAPYAGISILGFATEGTGSFNVTLRFTDNSTQVLNGQNFPDWFAAGAAIISGFDRCSRPSGTPNFQNSQPKMFNLDVVVSCANRAKNLARVIIQNTGAGPRVCTMAISGVSAPSFSVNTVAVSCPGGSNGSASISATNGIPPYGFVTSGPPVQFGPNPINLPVGVYSYTAQDVAACGITGTFAITQSLVPQPPLLISSNYSVICEGTPVIMAVSGANTFTWSATAANATVQTVTVTPASSTSYSVGGYTGQNCFRTGTFNVTVNPIPIVTLATIAPQYCTNSPCVILNGLPVNGFYSGAGVNNGTFCPSTAGTGTFVLSYQFTDPNNCSATSTLAVSVASLAAPVLSAPNASCVNAGAVQVQATPTGGIFTGTGVSATGILTPSLAGAGTNTIAYTISSGACTVSSVTSATLYPLPVVNFVLTKNFFCLNAPSLALNATPSAGTYAGPAVSGPFFSPSGAGAGTHTISYTYTDVNNCTTKVVNTVTVSTCAGLEENKMLQAELYPNPNNGKFTINALQTGELQIHNALGQIVFSQTVIGGQKQTIDTGILSAGIYDVILRGEGQAFHSKIVIESQGSTQ